MTTGGSVPAGILLASLLAVLLVPSCGSAPAEGGNPPARADLDGLLCERISVRSFSDSSLALEEVLELLWAGGGLLPDGRMTVPSAGALYPLRLLLVAGDVTGLEPGVYRYQAADSSLLPVLEGDTRSALAAACLGQPWVLDAPASILIAADPGVTTAHYGDRGMRYVFMEAGHSSQNIYLECASLGLGTVAVGAFADSTVASVTGLAASEIPLYVMPIGRTD